MSPLFAALLSIAMSVAGQFAFKAGMSGPAVQAALGQSQPVATALAVASNKFVLLGLLLYGLGAVVWLGVLARWDVSKAYPLVGAGFVVALLVGAAQGEQVSAARIAGALLICAGVALISRS